MKNLFSYPDNYFSLYKEAAQRKLELPFSSQKEAISERHRLHDFRVLLRSENHPLILEAQKVVIGLQDSTLILQPRGLAITQALERAGIILEEEKHDFDALDQALLDLALKKAKE